MTDRPSPPTEGQIKEFWEWCGWRFIDDYWFSPIPGEVFVKKPPSPDMTNLCKYAVTKLKARNKWNIELSSLVCYPNHYLVEISDSLNPQHETYRGQSGYPELALFWAIWELKDKEELWMVSGSGT